MEARRPHDGGREALGVNEATLQEHIIGTTPGREGVAVRFGWEVLHVRAGRTRHGWRVPVTGSLGAGWPDLILARPPRVLAVELKSPTGKVDPEQQHVLDVLALCGIETHVWRPADWESIVAALR